MRNLLLSSVAAALLLSGCSTGRVTYDSDPAQDFSQYSTFSWLADKPVTTFGNRPIPALLQEQIARSITNSLEAKGYRYIEDGSQADFTVSFTVGTRDGFDTVEVPDYYWQTRPAWGWGGGYWPMTTTMTTSHTEVRDYTEGTLSIDIFDVDRRAPVWHGAGVKHLSVGELSSSADIPGQVDKVLAIFPPQ